MVATHLNIRMHLANEFRKLVLDDQFQLIYCQFMNILNIFSRSIFELIAKVSPFERGFVFFSSSQDKHLLSSNVQWIHIPNIVNARVRVKAF